MGGLFDVPTKQNRIKEIEIEMSKDDFWNDINKANQLNKELTLLKKETSLYNNLINSINDDKEMLTLLDDNQTDMLDEITKDLEKTKKDIDELELSTMLDGEYDNNNCYLEIHPGAGGTESCDWASMLLRMYQRYCEKKKYKCTIIEYEDGDQAGIKSVTLHIEGENAYGYLKCEKGTHRLVRISPFDSNKRRHTSFASVLVTPEINQEIDIEIKEEDIRIDTYCASGHGGQGVNTTPSAVRITHFPSKIVVTCQNERSQIQNKETCMKVLKSRLFALEKQKKDEELNKLKGITSGIDFGTQIRSYVLTPYTLVKDYRSDFETVNVDDVLDGDLEEIIESILKSGAVK